MVSLKRREMLGLVGAGWLADGLLPDARPIQGRLLGASHHIGHLLRQPQPAVDGPAEACDVVVVGSGVSGLSAAWRLQAMGVRTRVLELESVVGGTSCSGREGGVAYPWGAHYLPVPEVEARATLRLLKQLDVVSGWDASGLPVFRSDYLCHAPEERVFYKGYWHMGMVPRAGLSQAERDEIDRFRAKMAELAKLKGRDGRSVFALPVEASSRDPEFLALDRMTMSTWLQREGFKTPFVRWYVGYGSLDDFGCDVDVVSAWAGLHYFCARKFASEQLGKGSRYLVWPEGNGWLVNKLRGFLPGDGVQTGALVTRIQPQGERVVVDYIDVAASAGGAAAVPKLRRKRLAARGVVLAVPGFVAGRLIESPALIKRQAAPWVVANLHVERAVDPNACWDNILYGSQGLGYVDASHHRLDLPKKRVWTYFRAFGGADPVAARRQLLQASWDDLAAGVVLDLAAAHPDIAQCTSRMDIKIWGHAMPRPLPGFRAVKAPAMVASRVAWAHVDQSGIALFEEANVRGVAAAEALAKELGVQTGETWT